MKKIDITELLPLSIKNLKDAVDFARPISYAMRCLYAGEGGPLKISSNDFYISLWASYSDVVEKSETHKKFNEIFSDDTLVRIIAEKNDGVCFEFNGSIYEGNFKGIEMVKTNDAMQFLKEDSY